jgi:hypothetical protein
MVMDSSPQIEVINNIRVRAIGSKYQDKIEQLKRELIMAGD